MEHPRHPPGPGRAAAIAVTAALIGPRRVLDGEGPGRVRVTATPSEPPSASGGQGEAEQQPVARREAPLAVTVLAVTVVLLAMVELPAGAVLGAHVLRRLRPRARERAVHAEFDVVDGSLAFAPGAEDG